MQFVETDVPNGGSGITVRPARPAVVGAAVPGPAHPPASSACGPPFLETNHNTAGDRSPPLLRRRRLPGAGADRATTGPSSPRSGRSLQHEPRRDRLARHRDRSDAAARVQGPCRRSTRPTRCAAPTCRPASSSPTGPRRRSSSARSAAPPRTETGRTTRPADADRERPAPRGAVDGSTSRRS